MGLTLENGLVPVELGDVSHTLKIDPLPDDEELTEAESRKKSRRQELGAWAGGHILALTAG